MRVKTGAAWEDRGPGAAGAVDGLSAMGRLSALSIEARGQRVLEVLARHSGNTKAAGAELGMRANVVALVSHVHVARRRAQERVQREHELNRALEAARTLQERLELLGDRRADVAVVRSLRDSLARDLQGLDR